MNNFLELHSSSDYLNSNRDYDTGTWEYIKIASDYLIPFQWETSETDEPSITRIDTDGNESGTMLGHFLGDELVTSMTKSGSGTWSVVGYFAIGAGTVGAGGYMYTNTITLTAGVNYMVVVNPDAYSDSDEFTLSLWKSAAQQWEESFDGWDGCKTFTVTTTGSDYRLRITNASGGTENCTETNVIELAPSSIHNSGNYWWYDGTALSGTALTDIFKMKLTMGSDVFYSDWCEVTGFSGLTKYKVSSSYDFGGIKYDEDYAQWIYKDAHVRRSPRADIEIIGDSRNGETINEKVISAVRYVMRCKVTEAEYEAFVHSVGGTVEITDATGRVFDAKNIEMSNPTWYRGNGVLEISFVDSNNINVWTMNNSSL